MTVGLRKLGFNVIDSHANFVWCKHPKRDSRERYELLKRSGLLVRYMNYEGWSDGLRISVGTDSAIDAVLAVLE